MNPFILVTIILTATVFVRGFINTINSLYVIRWLEQRKRKISSANLKTDKKIFFVLPVYKEGFSIQKVIYYYAKLLSYFSNTYLVIVPTAKENIDILPTKTTEYIARRCANRIQSDRVLVYTYPKTNGYMAHQVNYAAAEIQKKYTETENWMFLLNIDSLFTHKSVQSTVNRANIGGKKVYQYSAVFVRNFEEFYGKSAYLLKAAAIFQSRWTLTHEIRRYLLNTGGSWFAKYQYAHAVGHGLFIPLDIFSEIRFPETSPTEDSAFGFILRAHGIKIEPTKFLEIADSPTSIKEHLNQKYIWAFGPLWQVFYLFEFQRKYPNIYKQNTLKLYSFTFQGMTTAMAWMTMSWIFIWLIISLWFSPTILIACIIFALLLYSMDFVFTMFFLHRNKYLQLNLTDLVLLYFWIWIVLLIQSFPANMAFIMTIVDKLGFSKIQKKKTSHVL